MTKAKASKAAKPAKAGKPPATGKPPTTGVASVAAVVAATAPASTPATQLSSVVSACDLLMGDSGSGKTSLLATLAEWVWKVHHQVTLLYSADPGGWVTEVQTLINRGIIRVWKVPSRDPEDKFGLAFETCSRASQGYWPKEFLDLEKGRVPIGVDLVPPVSYEFKLYCAKGHVVRRVSVEGQLNGQFICAPDGDPKACGLAVSIAAKAKVTRSSRRMKGFENVGAVAYDGLTSMCAWAMRDLQDRGARVQEGEKDQLRSSMKIESGDMTFGSSTPSHYGAAQSLAERMLNAAGTIPYLVARPVWTALEKRGTDDKAQMVIYGPEIPGSAKTSSVPQWVGNVFGVCSLPVEKGQVEWRLYLRRYYTPGDPVPHLAKTRVAPGYMPEFLSDGPVDDMGNPVSGVKPFTSFNLGTFYEMEQRALEQQQKEKDMLYPGAPGLAPMEIGEDRLDEGSGVMTGAPVSAMAGPRAGPTAGPTAGAAPRAPTAPPAPPPAQAPAPSAPVQTVPPAATAPTTAPSSGRKAPPPAKTPQPTGNAAPGPRPGPRPGPPVVPQPAEPPKPAEPAAAAPAAAAGPQPGPPAPEQLELVPPAGPRPPVAGTPRPATTGTKDDIPS